MLLQEIKIGGIYKTTLKVQFRTEKEVEEVDFFVRVVGKTCSNGFVEICFLNSNTVYYLEPSQLDKVE